MPERVKQNFRYDNARWLRAQDKAVRMRRVGYTVDMTLVLSRAVDAFLDETDAQTAERLELERAAGPVPIRRLGRPVRAAKS